MVGSWFLASRIVGWKDRLFARAILITTCGLTWRSWVRGVLVFVLMEESKGRSRWRVARFLANWCLSITTTTAGLTCGRLVKKSECGATLACPDFRNKPSRSAWDLTLMARCRKSTLLISTETAIRMSSSLWKTGGCVFCETKVATPTYR